ncbi:hypothetical protein ILYODFUR_001141 [Ilyodon furcidens]|uniref:Uncharacterized protein n=1 Tax=Ilyodon furcidens TaxID=33524 RepID=A0ABV0VCY7_9TELE
MCIPLVLFPFYLPSIQFSFYLTFTLIPHTLLPILHFLFLFVSLLALFPSFYFSWGASKHVALKSWESIDLGRVEVEQGHLVQFKRDQGILAKGLDTELLLLLFLCKITFFCVIYAFNMTKTVCDVQFISF